MGDPSEGAELTPTSGDVCLARLCAHPQPLSMETLQGARDGLERCRELGEELGSCLNLALERFCREPLCVQENARLLIRWAGGELEFVSGQGQCEVSVSSSAGEPQYHITEKTWDMFVSSTNLHPEPLSIKNLERVQNTLESWGALGHWGALGKELRSCFGEAISQFSREPPSVQENARLLIQWGRRQLRFTSGKEECEITVRYGASGPQYCVRKIPVLVYLARVRACRPPLSTDILQRVLSELGICHGDTSALRACFDRAWQGFRREPRCVQENARLLIRWGREELEFVSGQGQCKISVLLADGEPQYRITALGGDRPVTWSHTSPEPLSVANLARVLDRLGHWGALGEVLSSCFEEAISQFGREPRCVQENARMRICWDGGSLEFLSGEGECEILVRYRNRRPQYNIGELPVHMYLAQLRAHPDPLSADTLKRVRDKLGSCKGNTNTMRACFSSAWKFFSREPQCVQENARLLIRWGGGELELLSGQGQYTFSFSYQEGNPRYYLHAGDLPVHLYVARLHSRKDPLSADSLLRFYSDLGRCRGDNGDPRACLHRAWEGFRQEPRCVQENARLLIQWGGEELEFVSGQGQCEISVLLADGEPQYHITALVGDRPVTWSHASPEPLSVTDLARVRDRLGHWGALGEELSSCFGEAISQFSREPWCVQENARLLIRWGGGELEFVSGQGQCEISVLLADGEPQYHITELGGDRPVTWSHTSPEPLSVTDLARVRDRLGHWGALGEELSSCFGEAISQFSQEPPYVQENARLRLCWDRGSLEFLSGEGKYTISVSYRKGNPRYKLRVEDLPGHLNVAWLRFHKDRLCAESLLRFYTDLGSHEEDTGALRVLLYEAWEGFRREPQCVQENTRLLIRWGGGELEFISGRGENLITVCKSEEGRIQYTVQVSGWWPWIARLLISFKVLSRG